MEFFIEPITVLLLMTAFYWVSKKIYIALLRYDRTKKRGKGV